MSDMNIAHGNNLKFDYHNQVLGKHKHCSVKEGRKRKERRREMVGKTGIKRYEFT